MRRSSSVLSLFLILLIISGQEANAKKVKFTLDLSGYTANTTGVHVSGDFQEVAGFEGGNWQPGTTTLGNEPGTDHYSVVVDIPAGAKYEYKFLNGDQWYDVEFVPVESRVGYDFNDNRRFYLDSLAADTTLIGPIPFSGNAPAGKRLLRFRVDMQLQAAIDPAGVHVAGNFQGWDPKGDMMYSFDGYVYEHITYVEESSPECRFRYVNGNTDLGYETVPGWCSSEGDRYIALTKDTILDVVCFGFCLDCSTAGTAGYEELRPEPHLFPNPAHSLAVLEFNDALENHEVTVTDLLGKIRLSYCGISSKSLEIPCYGMKQGIYLVSISSGGRWLSTQRLCIAR